LVLYLTKNYFLEKNNRCRTTSVNEGVVVFD